MTNSINFHRYDTNPFGQSNTQHAHQVKGALSIKLTEKVVFSHNMGVGKSFTYGGADRNNFFISDQLSISMGDINFSLGHTNGGDLLTPNGQDYNFSVFNLDSSSFNIGINLNSERKNHHQDLFSPLTFYSKFSKVSSSWRIYAFA